MSADASSRSERSPGSSSAGSSDRIRLASVDAYRGLVMFLMMAEVLHLCRVAAKFPESGFWKFLCFHQSHVPWVGCSLHDLIQPSFSFLVGVALPFSIINRRAVGQSFRDLAGHAGLRALILVLLGVFLRSTGRSQTNWTFEDTLSQIGLGYFFLFLLAFRPRREQWIALITILIGYWALFAFYPLPGPEFDTRKVGMPPDWPHQLTGFAAHWNLNTNPAWAFDQWILNLFPRKDPWLYNGGGYSTLSFIPTLGTMILGLLAGGILKSVRTHSWKVSWLLLAGLIGLASGWVLNWSGFAPVVKKIWTPSWVLFSGGWCFLILAGFYWVMDVKNRKKGFFPLVVIGLNSIAAYVMAHLFEGFIYKNLKTHLGQNAFQILGKEYEPLLHGLAVLLVLWLILFWMHRRRIYLRI